MKNREIKYVNRLKFEMGHSHQSNEIDNKNTKNSISEKSYSFKNKKSYDNGLKGNTGISIKSHEFELLHKSSLPNYLKIYEKKNSINKNSIPKSKKIKKNFSNLSSSSIGQKEIKDINAKKKIGLNIIMSEGRLNTINNYKHISTTQDKNNQTSEYALLTQVTQQSILNTKPCVSSINSKKFSFSLVEKLSKFDGNNRVHSIRKQGSNTLKNSSLNNTNRSQDLNKDKQKELVKKTEILNNDYIDYLRGVKLKREVKKETSKVEKTRPISMKRFKNFNVSNLIRSTSANNFKNSNENAIKFENMADPLCSSFLDNRINTIGRLIEEDPTINTILNTQNDKYKRNKSTDLQNGRELFIKNLNEINGEDPNQDKLINKPIENPINFSFDQENQIFQEENHFSIHLIQMYHSTEKSVRENKSTYESKKKSNLQELNNKERDAENKTVINSFDSIDSKSYFEFIPTNEYN